MNTVSFSNLDLDKGLPLSEWKSFEFSLKGAENPKVFISEIKSTIADIADKSLEAGRYELAAAIGCSSPLLQVKALIFSSQRASAQELIEKLPESPIKSICSILFDRTSGQSLKVFQSFAPTIEAIIAQLSGLEKVEARIQWASVLYNLEKWDHVIDQYKVAFELAEKFNFPGSRAVIAFNIATVYENLCQKIESKTWLWMCQKELTHYHLDSLKNSVGLFEIQCSIKTYSYEETLERTQIYLRGEDLSPVQRIRALHAQAEAQSELGFILDAEMTLSLSRKVIQQSQYNQFNSEQEIIELNLASIIHRPSRFQNRKSIEKYSLQTQHKAAHARWLFKMNDSARTLKLALEIKKEMTQGEDFEDLFVLLTNRLEHPGKKARTLEHQILKSWLAKQWKGIEFIKTYLEIEKTESPWKVSLYQLCCGLLAIIQSEKSTAKQALLEGLKVTQNYGLERLQTLMVSLLKTFKLDEMSLNVELSGEELAFYESLISRLQSAPVTVSRNERGQITLGSEKSDLVFDEDKNEIIWQEQSISLSQQPLLKRILKTLFESPAGLTKERLVESVWGFEYHPLHHDPMIYSAISRLRDLIPIEMEEGLYKFPKGIRWVYLSQDKQSSMKLSVRQKTIMSLLEKQGSLSRKDVVQNLSVSERTALRELTQLVRLGLLTQLGAGRGVHYMKWNQGA